MKNNFLFWLPRILGILFAVFISIFALDAFGEGIPVLEAIIGFVIHLVPTYIVVAILLIAWKWEWVGGVLFILAGTFYLVKAHNQHWTALLLIGGPPILIGILFITSFLLSKKKITNNFCLCKLSHVDEPSRINWIIKYDKAIKISLRKN